MYSTLVLNSMVRVVDIIKATHIGWIGNVCIANNIYECTRAYYELI